MSRHVGIVGAGFSGTALAVALLAEGARVTVVERASRLGVGLAYGAAGPDHLLNARALRMSALPGDPDHFARWWQARGGEAGGFAPRADYGAYLKGWAARAFAAAGDALAVRRGEAVDVVGTTIVMAEGAPVAAETVVLALGNWAPGVPAAIPPDVAGSALFAADPWAGDLADGLGADDHVLLLGTGLTAIDAALTLERAGFAGRMTMLSRRGLLPRVHGIERPGREQPPAGLEPRCTALVRTVRREAARIGWPVAVNAMRAATQALWRSASDAERRRFLRHLRPWWDVHRHRVAPEVGARIAALRAAGRLDVAAGRLVDVAAGPGGATVAWRPRGGAALRRITAARIVNCTGPDGDISTSDDPLIRALVASGRIRPDPLRIGIDVDPRCRAIDADGRASPALLAIGPPTRGTFWEIVAVPDLRDQVAMVAASLR